MDLCIAPPKGRPAVRPSGQHLLETDPELGLARGGQTAMLQNMPDSVALPFRRQSSQAVEVKRIPLHQRLAISASQNVQQAAGSTQEVTSNISGVSEAAGTTGKAADQMLDATETLSHQSESLRGQVENFLAGIRAA